MPHEGVDMTAQIQLNCTGSFSNFTSPSVDGTQTQVKCEGELHMTAEVSTKIPEDQKRNNFFLEYACRDSFSVVIHGDSRTEGDIGWNFYQNAVCDGSEGTLLTYSAEGEIIFVW